jgi:hypothetical protein
MSKRQPPGRREVMRQLLALPLACVPAPPAPALALDPVGSLVGSVMSTPQNERGWRPLFDGRTLAGWETFLGRPHRSSDQPGARDDKGEYVDPIGVGRDPKRVFSVVTLADGPAIQISGEIYGALTTVEEFGDYHLRFDVKWGDRKWPQRGELPRDTGCCYHAVGPHGASYGFWMQSCEFQIMEKDCGDFYGLAGVMADAEGVLSEPSNPKSDAIYRPGAGAIRDHTRRIVKSADHEKPHGEWNTLDLYCAGQDSLHVVNGRAVMKLSRLRQRSGDRQAPLRRGRIQLQSEGCEVYFRNLSIRPIRALPTITA